MIIHITGPSGSGKTTLGNYIQKKCGSRVVVIDSDDIDDKNAMHFLKHQKYTKWFTNITGMKRYDNEREKMNKIDLQKILDKAEAANKHVVVVGHTISVDKADTQYHISIDRELLYRRLTSRTISDMCDHSEEVQRLLRGKQPLFKIHALMLHKYKIRVPVPEPPFMFIKYRKDNVPDGAVALKPEEILRRVCRAVKQQTERHKLKGGSKIRMFNPHTDSGRIEELMLKAFDYSRLPLPSLTEIKEMKGFILDENGDISAYLLYSLFESTRDPKNPLWYYLEYIGTHPSSQGKGHGKKLMQRFIELLDDDQVPSFLDVEEGSPLTDVLLDWYPRFGYKVFREHIPSKSDPSVKITKLKRIID